MSSKGPQWGREVEGRKEEAIPKMEMENGDGRNRSIRMTLTFPSLTHGSGPYLMHLPPLPLPLLHHGSLLGVQHH